MNRLEILLRSKTFWAAVTAIVGAAAGYFTGELTPSVAVQMVTTAVIGLFLRDGIARSQVVSLENQAKLEVLEDLETRTHNMVRDGDPTVPQGGVK